MASIKEIAECTGFRTLREKSPKHILDKSLLAACYGEAVWKVEDKHYCVMHAPTEDKSEAFEKAKAAKLESKDYNFRGAWFPLQVNFEKYTFTKGVNFSYAVFKERADFSYARFTGTSAIYFIGTQFTSGARFNDAHLSGNDISFRGALFAVYADFENARFEKGTARFSEARFSGYTDFSKSRFEGKEVRFSKTQFAGSTTNFSEFTGINANFGKAQFSGGEVSFSEARFSGGDTDFGKAEFRGGEVSFNGAQFSGGDTGFIKSQFSGRSTDFGNVKFRGKGTYFRDAQFGGDVIFSDAQFDNKTDFTETQFNGGNVYFDKSWFVGPETNFRKAVFSGSVYFTETNFSEHIKFNATFFGNHAFFDDAVFEKKAFVDFRLAQFTNLMRFIGCRIRDGAQFYFGEAIFDKPERIYFSSIKSLELQWFLDTDTREFIYEDVRIPALEEKNPVPDALGKARELLMRIDKLDGRSRTIPLPYRRLITVLRRMADNAEKNSRFEYASIDRRLAFEAERLERAAQRIEWRRGTNDPYPLGILQFLYRWLSGYGESWSRALLVLFLIWVGFAVLYTSPFLFQIAEKDADKAPSLWNFSTFAYSFLVMALQKPEPVPVNALGKLLIGFETVFAPIQLALLALAIRRKFMR